ncbi:MAG: hypothetical protein COB67_10795 [SAR324 cluster bacterium]|uniref:Uncharacterized protein n=1 Tax=SAR324 cluster bacterium TaxID=2024889 RepID=A0A2A4SVD5_9DELT|nr:MAG: hypothetical protein COB67_10795 [SAR324 cluster bacterium]
MIEHLYEFKEYLHSKGIFFSFHGPLSQEIMVEIGDSLRKRMKLEEASNSTILKVFSMLVEQSQNILHYSSETTPIKVESKEPSLIKGGLIVVGYQDGEYFVVCGNQIKNTRIKGLESKLKKIQSMNREELKAYYKEQRKLGPDADSKGAGLGFIEMARKSSRPIEFYFQTIDEEHSYFSFKTVI